MSRKHLDHSDQPIGPEKVDRPDVGPQWIPTDALQAAFPTAFRERQKAKEAAIKLETGQKYVPKPKPKHIEFGNDDCGEDLSSIAWVDAIECPYDHGAP
eukprot:2077587-Prorocentrum_lima.AAC.1